jgi:hypothetical protein
MEFGGATQGCCEVFLSIEQIKACINEEERQPDPCRRSHEIIILTAHMHQWSLPTETCCSFGQAAGPFLPPE